MKLPKKALTWGLILLLLALIIATIILGSVPPVDRDALTHHLFVPKLWLKHGGIYEIPEIPFSYYPMNLDLLYTIPLYFGNDIIPKYIHYFFALLTGLLLYRHLKKRLGVHYGLFGALFFLSVPIIVKLSITVYVDLGVVFFTTASLLLLLHWAEQNFKWRSLVLAGLCCGLAAGTKYNGLISIIVLTLFVPIIYQQNTRKEKQSNGKALLWGCVFGLAALTSFSPWLIRNYAWTGNPIYPLHNSLFQKLHQSNDNQQGTDSASLANTLQQISRQGSNAFIGRKTLYNESWWQALLLPIRFFIEGNDDDPRYFDGKLTPFLLILPALALLFRPTDAQQRREQNFLFSFAALYFFLAFFQEAMRIRYIVPIVPPLVILTIYGLRGLITTLSIRSTSTPRRKIAVTIVAIGIPFMMLCYNGQYCINQFTIVQPIPYVQGKISRDDYLTAFRPEYPAIRFANTVATKDAKVLCLFLGNRGYYMDFHPVFEQPYASDGILTRFLADENQQHSIIDEMRQRKISHILLRSDLTAQWLHQLSDKDRQRIAPLFAHSEQPLWNGQGHILLTVEPQKL
ncbi:MAG: glycosyltransferase family 39 protein [Desulfobulbus sp.]|nr:glycosyltransferase family 39 protein [Desulfobulbus sp.]